MSINSHLWGIILAGGEGRRLQDYIRSRYGIERPKQYSAIVGNKTMLRHTLDRVEKIIPLKQLRIVIARKHHKYLPDVLNEREQRSVLIAPKDRESAASVYLALSHICVRDPDAITTIFPSDHFIGDEKRFMEYVEQAISFISEYPPFVALLGIKPRDANPEYGWIEISKNFLRHEGNRFYKVSRFMEKPGLEKARELFEEGCLWNSMVLAAKCTTLIQMYRQHVRSIYDAFRKAKTIYGTDEEEKYINDAFESIPTKNFSKSILEEIPESLYILKVEGVLWSDWGNKDQILRDLDLLGLTTQA